MFKIVKKGEFWTIAFLLLALLVIYRDVILKNKIVFPANLLVSFYSPWATQKFPGYPNGIPNKPIGGNDQVRMFYPFRTFTNESFARGEFPLWNPYNFSGSPLLANYQSAIFYPFNIIYFLLPQITAWSILVIIQPLLGTLFMYLYLRQFIPQKLAAFFGAFAFGFSGFILAWSQENAVVGQTALWFPLILYAIDKFISNFKLGSFLLLVASLATCIFAGHLQPALTIFFIAFCYGIFRISNLPKKQKLTKLFFFLCSFLICFLVCAIQLVPSIEAFPYSPRSSTSIQPVLDTYLLPITYYITFLAPDIFGNPGVYNFFGRGFYQESICYIGIIPLVFAFLSIIKMRSQRIVRFFTIVSLLTIIFGVKSFFTQWFYTLPIPLINTFTPSRIFLITSFSLAALSAFGFSFWLKKGTKKTRAILFPTVVVMAIILLLFIISNYFAETTKSAFFETISYFISSNSHILLPSLKVAARNIILPLFMLISIVPLTLIQYKIKFSKIAIVLLLCVGQFYFLNKYVVISNREFLYPDHFIFSDIQNQQNLTNRFLSFGLPILSNINLFKHVYSPDGFDPLFPKRYGQLIYASKNGGKYTNEIPRIEANVSEYAENENIINNQRRLKLISLLGVTRVYNYETGYKDLSLVNSIFPKDIFKPLWKQDNWQALENTKAYPRAFFVDNYIVEKNPQKNLDLIFNQNTDLRKTVILEEKPDNFSQEKSGSSFKPITDVILKIYKPQFIQLEVETDRSRILFLSDNYYPGWKATVDEVSTKIYRANFTFRAIVVPEGKHTITYQFKPLSFTIGAYISLITILLLVFIIIKIRLPQVLSNFQLKKKLAGRRY